MLRNAFVKRGVRAGVRAFQIGQSCVWVSVAARRPRSRRRRAGVSAIIPGSGLKVGVWRGAGKNQCWGRNAVSGT
eukprot:11184636-Lingulodinium_polyedra.AAC.1